MKGIPNMGNLMKQAQQFQAKFAKLQEELAEKTVEGTAGGGMVSVVANGKQEILKVRIDPEVVDPEDIEMLQDLILAAVNDAHRKVDETLAQQMSGMMGGMKLPGMF